jgi:hypothetical protein
MRNELQNQEALEAFVRALTLERKRRLINNIDTELNRLKGISTQVFRKFEGRLQLVGSAFYLTYKGRLFFSAQKVGSEGARAPAWAKDERHQRRTGILDHAHARSRRLDT